MENYSDHMEGLRSDHAESMREERKIAESMRREHLKNIDDYPEFYYG